jgi:hypothetical protein
MEGLYVTRYQGRISRLEACKTGIIEDFNKNPASSVAQAAARSKELTGIERKPTQVRAFMRRHGFKYRKKNKATNLSFWCWIMPNINTAGPLWKKPENWALPYSFYHLILQISIS